MHCPALSLGILTVFAATSSACLADGEAFDDGAAEAGLDDDDSGGGDDGEDAAAVDGPRIRVLLDVDPDQIRVDSFGQPAPFPPAGHAALSPDFLVIGAHSAELVPHEFTLLGAGEQLFDSEHRDDAVDFDALPRVSPGDELWSGALSTLAPGTYKYLRLSVSYQQFRVPGTASFAGNEITTPIEIVSVVESKMYIDAYDIGDDTVEIDGVREQGYFGAWSQYTGVTQGQAPVGSTTVPNPLDATSPIPVTSCVVAAVLDPPLVITGDEEGDLTFNITMSTNNSFEWIDDGDGKWQPLSEPVVDMGLRGMLVEVQ